MKKIFFVLGVLALAVAGFAMFKILTFNDYGKSETNPTETGNSVEEKATEGTEEARQGESS